MDDGKTEIFVNNCASQTSKKLREFSNVQDPKLHLFENQTQSREENIEIDIDIEELGLQMNFN